MKKYILFAAALLGLVACNKNNEVNAPLEPGKPCTLTATINLPEQNQSSARMIAPVNPSAATVTFKWQEGDQITISRGTEKQVFTVVNSSISGNTANFTGDALTDMSSYTVTYGDVSSKSVDYIAGSYKPFATGEGANNSFTISSYCPVLALKLTGTVTLTSIKYYVSDVLSTTLHMGTGVALSSTDTTIYFPVIDAADATKAKLEFCDADGVVMSKTAPVAIENSKVYGLPELEVKAAPATKGKAKRKLAGGGEVDVEWVQLWAGGPKWATYNVGATAATEYGGYYCWGNNADKGTTYSSSTEDIQYGNDDTAKNLWGSNWQMPTGDQLQALINNTTYTWTTNYLSSDVQGYLLTGKDNYTDNSIFLPAAGYYDGGVYNINKACTYHSSTPQANYALNAKYLLIMNGFGMVSNGAKNKGQSVRAILHE